MMTRDASITAHKKGTHLNTDISATYPSMTEQNDSRRHFEPGGVIDGTQNETDDG
jgi:hypothetical protein